MKPSSKQRSPSHPLTLRFEDERLERLFRAEWADSSRSPTRVSLGLVAGLFVVYLALDWALYPEQLGLHLAIRGGVVAVLLSTLGLSWHSAWEAIRAPVLAVAGLAAAGALLGFVWLMPGDPAIGYAEGVGLVVLGTFTLFRLPLPAATINAGLVVATYSVTTILLVDVPGDRLLAGHFFVGSAFLIGGVAAYNIERFARRSFVDERAVDRERGRSERLLRNVLPDSIVERLKEEPGPIADGFDGATVVFADLVDFSGLSARVEPDSLVRFLNELYTDFDRVVRERGLEKIKTIGDAYVAVAGVPIPVDDHVERAAEAAMGILEEAGRRTVNGGHPVELRLGIATGPVVAGVIGEAKFSYDVWGEPVTLASRMQAHGVAGRIQVTEPVVRALEGRYAFEPRGEIEVKGRGRMPVWFLDGPLRSG